MASAVIDKNFPGWQELPLAKISFEGILDVRHCSHRR